MTDIKLTKKEEKIFKTLLDINEKYELNTTFRVAGGWVRDKLLGKESQDIDISIDTMTGAKFGEYLKKEKHIKVHVIEQNHEQSKHLEVVTGKIEGIEIDIVNLRSETYQDSRIPEIKVGTPQEDAERRDLTINSLFYNINTNKVEDFTGKGLSDIKEGLIRTPLDPEQTFRDDPLRILRAVRFHVKYRFKLDPQLMLTVMNSDEIRTFLFTKVSPERRLIELRKMIDSNPNETVMTLSTLHILKPLMDMEHFAPSNYFADIKTKDPKELAKEEDLIDDRYLLKDMFAITFVHACMSKCSFPKMDFVSFLSTMYLELEEEEIIEKLEKLKITNKEKKEVLMMINFLKQNAILANVHDKSLGEYLVCEYMEDYPFGLRCKTDPPNPVQEKIGSEKLIDLKIDTGRSIIPFTDKTELLKVVKLFEWQCNRINRDIDDKEIMSHVNLLLKMESCMGLKPALNGHDVMKNFGVKGKEIKKYLDTAIDYQILYGSPYSTNGMIKILTDDIMGLLNR